MLEYLRKKSIKKDMPWILILILVAIVILAIQVPHMILCYSKHETFENLEWQSIHDGMMVDINMTENFGCCAEKYSEKATKKTTTDLYYVVWTGNEYVEDYRYMCVVVQPKYESQLDQMAEDYYNGKTTTPVQFSGTIRKMESEELNMLYNYFEGAGYSRSEAMDATIPYCIDTKKNVGIDKVMKTLGFVFNIAVIGLFIFLLIWVIKGGHLIDLKKEIESSPYSLDQAAMDFDSAEEISKKPMFRKGRLFVFFLNSATPHAFALENLVWVYPHVTTHRTNGIKTGTTYEIMFVDKNNKRVKASMGNKKEMEHVMDYLSERLNWVIFGYSDELIRLNINQLMELRYNQVPDKNMLYNDNNFNY